MKNGVAVIVMVGVVCGIFVYTAVQTSFPTAGAAVGVVVVFALVVVGLVVGLNVVVEALTRKFPRLGRQAIPPMPPQAQRRLQIIWGVVVLALAAWAIYDPPRIKSKTPIAMLGDSIAWGIHDLLGLAPHDWRTWRARSNALEAKLVRARANAADRIHMLVAQGRDLESAKFLVATELRRLRREAAAAKDSVSTYAPSLARYLDRTQEQP